MWNVFEAHTANELWSKTYKRICTAKNTNLQNGRTGTTVEILHAALTLTNPRARWTTNRQPALNIAFALAEIVWILAGRQDATFLTYFNRSLRHFSGSDDQLHGAYGHRLRKHFSTDQLDRAYGILRTNPDSRQVILQIWDSSGDTPSIDGQPANADIPCNTQSMLKVRDGKLEWVQILRSNDVFLGLPYNLIQFTMLHEIMAGWLGLKLGHYHHMSDSLHLYTRDLDIVYETNDEEITDVPVFSSSKEQTEQTVTQLAKAVELIINESLSGFALLDLLGKHTLTKPYDDILRVLLAEGLRRRGMLKESSLVMNGSTTPVFNTMWLNWTQRVSRSKSK